MPKTGIHWFRHGLRIHDNPALVACLDEVERFIPVYIFDGKTSGTEICGFVRFRFLLQSLKDLEKQFKSFGFNFMCFYGEPHEIFEKLISELDVQVISFEKDSEAIWNKRDTAVIEMCRRKNVQVIERVSHTLYDPDELCSINYGSPPNTFEKLKSLCMQLGEPGEPVFSPDLKFYSAQLLNTDDIYVETLHKVQNLDYFNMKPECKEQELVKFIGGETKALELFSSRYEYEKECFKKGIVNPNLVKPLLDYVEIPLSPYFRFGCLSVRKYYSDIKKAYFKYYIGEKDNFVSAEQLLWREFFYQLSYKNDNFDRIDGNAMSFKIPWDWRGGDHLAKKWELGQTGYPWIDACMRQLRQEGWMHHLCRNSVAVFLTRGQCFISWPIGHRVFIRYLIDGDWSVNAGNWNWVSCGDPEEITENTSKICPVKNGKKVDPNGDFTRKYCPELKNLPIEYLFEPWKTPINIQEEKKCIIGKDYPEPCIDYEQALKENLLKLKQYFLSSDRKSLFDVFGNENNAIKPTNSYEFQSFTYAKFLETIDSDIDDID